MVRLEPVLVVALAASLLSPVVVAHEGGDGVLNVVASPGTPRVGEMVDLTYYLFEDGRLVPHVDTDVHLSQNGEQLLSLASTHEHDGVHHATVRFTEPGPFSYTVVAETDDGPVERTFTGEVLPAGERTDVGIDVQAPDSVQAGEPIEIDVALQGPDDGSPRGSGSDNGSSVVVLEQEKPDHRIWIRLYREPTGKLVRRAETGPLLDEPNALVTAINVPGTYTLQVEAYPANGSSFAPVVERRTIEVEPGAATGPLGEPDLPLVMATEATPDETPRLVLEVDPTTEVGPLADLKVDALLLDGDHPVRDVWYRVEITGPAGATVLATEGTQPDGIAEWFAHTPKPGTYGIEVTAATEDVDRRATTSYTVVPPTEPGLPGTVQPTFDRILDGDGPHEMGLAFEDATGEPMEHVEADLEVYAPGEQAPRWTTKLHTHDHDVAWTAGFGTDGGHYLKVNPSPQSPTAEQIHAPGGPTAELGFGFHVETPDPVAAVAQPEDAPGEPTPWPAILAVAALAATAVWRRRV